MGSDSGCFNNSWVVCNRNRYWKMKEYKSKYKLKVIKLIEEGYENQEIAKMVDCHPKYPSAVRREWNTLDRETKAVWLKRIGDIKEEPKKKEEEHKVTKMVTPTSLARGRAYISRY